MAADARADAAGLGADLSTIDPEIAALIRGDTGRQSDTIDLIAAESLAPAAVLEALGSVVSNKTAEGYPGHRYHRGTLWVDGVEALAIERAKALFGAGHANAQAHSGVNANLAVYHAVLKPGDPVLSMRLAHGGHLSHGDPASITGRIYRFEHYGVRAGDERIDLDEVRDLARRQRPRLIVAGGSAYPRAIDYAAFAEIAREAGALLLVDMAHVAGLVAAGVLASPVPHADLVTFTTYKTLLGPHGGMILCRPELARKVDRAIFPGTQGAPDFARIAAKAVCLRIAAGAWFRGVQARIVAAAEALATALEAAGDRLVTGGTDNHLVLLDLRARGLTGDVAEQALESVGILTNRNMIPFDPGTPDVPSGLRLGTTTISERGMGAPEMAELAALIDAALRTDDPGRRASIADGVAALARRFPAYPVAR
jgi:glycine hydroxymethyltransferase